MTDNKVIGGTDYCAFCQKHVGEPVDGKCMCKECKDTGLVKSAVNITVPVEVMCTTSIIVEHRIGALPRDIKNTAREYVSNHIHDVTWEDEGADTYDISSCDIKHADAEILEWDEINYYADEEADVKMGEQ